MTTLVLPTEESALQKETGLFAELFSRLGNALLNRIFDLSPESASRRFQNFAFLFLFTWFLISLRYHPIDQWAGHLQNVFLAIFNPAVAQTFTENPFFTFFFFAWRALTDPRVFQYFPIFLASFFIALQSAAIYLADVFELEEVGVAREFVWTVALSGGRQVIRVSQGEVAEGFRETPAFLIGGPGVVVVDLDSVALFEKSNGIPHVIGPGAAKLDGFERFRQAIDIRDHYVDLRDQDPRSQSVKSRSRDGIPITATDVRLVFSVFRGQDAKPSTALPYPFSKEAVEQIIYKSSSRVTPDLPNPSTYEFSWINNMIGLIRGRLGGFMNQHRLTVYLASTGLPEFEKVKQREESIAEQVQLLTQSTDEPSKANGLRPPPKFTPRYEITNLFTQFAEEFTKSARNSGVELRWIGVGTWKTPVEIVPEKHLEAWKQSQDNIFTGSDENMDRSQGDAIIRKMESLIKSVPFEAYHEIMGTAKQTRRPMKKETHKPKELEENIDDLILDEEESTEGFDNMLKILALSEMIKDRSSSHSPEHRDAMRMLLLEYRKQFIEAVEFMKVKREAVPSNIEEAIKHINSVLGYKHWAGSL